MASCCTGSASMCDGMSVGVSPLLDAVEGAFGVALSLDGVVNKMRHVSACFFKSGGMLFSLLRKNFSRVVRACLACPKLIVQRVEEKENFPSRRRSEALGAVRGRSLPISLLEKYPLGILF